MTREAKAKAEQLRAEIQARLKAEQNGHLEVQWADDLSTVKPIRWLWHNKIVIGYLNLLVGEEGTGKGAFAAKLIAMLTKGELEGHYFGKPIRVGVIGIEDGWGDVWQPRLIAAGADLKMVGHIRAPEHGYITLTNDLERIIDLVREQEIQFLFLDALLDNLGTKVDDWRNKQVRDALLPVKVLGQDLDIAVLALLHPNKKGESFRNIVAGTVAFNAVSRSSLLLARDPVNKDKRHLVQGKSNLAKLGDGIAFNIEEQRHFIGTLASEFVTPVVSEWWDSSMTADELVKGVPKEPSNVDLAERIIRNELPTDEQWHYIDEIYARCKEDGIGTSAIARARDRLGIQNRREKSAHAKSQWRWAG